jgi:hypothetical protein
MTTLQPFGCQSFHLIRDNEKVGVAYGYRSGGWDVRAMDGEKEIRLGDAQSIETIVDRVNFWFQHRHTEKES